MITSWLLLSCLLELGDDAIIAIAKASPTESEMWPRWLSSRPDRPNQADGKEKNTTM